MVFSLHLIVKTEKHPVDIFYAIIDEVEDIMCEN